MPVKKTASSKHKLAKGSRKKAAKRKPVSKSKSAGTKRTVSKKKVSAKKKTVARKKPATKKSASRKVTKKKPAAKKKASQKKVSGRKPAAKKKASSKKPPTGKKQSAKKVSRQKPAAKKKASVKKVSPIKATRRKVIVRPDPVLRKPQARGARSSADMLSGPIHGIEPYVSKRGEEYMSPQQLAHFDAILSSWKSELMLEVDRTVHHMQDEAANFPDPNDRATQESEFGLELRTRDRERKLLRKINAALARIEEGTYGFCEETGEEIGLKRLEARPVATLCVEAQERRELAERQYRDRDDRYR